MKTYRGYRDGDGICHVVIREEGKSGRRLPRRLDLARPSPTGFEWGYGGSGPRQLALALLADALGDDARALRLSMDFKWSYVAKLWRDEPWKITDAEVSARADALEARQEAKHGEG
jgi:hypothetical protein